MSFLPTSQQSTLPNSRGILRGGPLVAGVEVSIVISEAHNISSTATRTALESGSQVTDHVILDPIVVAVTFEVSNAGDGRNVSKDVFATFMDLRNKRTVLEVLTDHAAYDNMVIVGLTPLHQAPFKSRLQCTATLQQITQVKIETVGRDLKQLSKDASKTASSQVNSGTQQGEEITESLIRKIKNKVTGVTST